MKETHRESVNNCPCCGEIRIKRKFTDWNGISYQICKMCRSVYQNPRLFFEYEENYWGLVIDPDGKERDLKNERDFKVKNWYGNTVKFVNSLPSGKILDVGAGLGFFLSALHSNWEKYALENSTYATTFMKKEYPDIKVQRGELNDYKIGDVKFDVIMFYHVIEHLPNPKKDLKILNKLLKKDGILIVGTPNINSLTAYIFRKNFRLFGPGHLCLFNPNSLKNILTESGFNVFRTEYPFWKTDYATFTNIIRIINPFKISPPFYGNIMTFFAQKIGSI